MQPSITSKTVFNCLSFATHCATTNYPTIGGFRRAPPRPRVQILSFRHIKFSKRNRLAPPPPPPRKSLDPPLPTGANFLIDVKFENPRHVVNSLKLRLVSRYGSRSSGLVSSYGFWSHSTYCVNIAFILKSI